MNGKQPQSRGGNEERIPELAPLPGNPRIIEREEHSVSRKRIDPDCLKVMTRLLRHGHRAFLVGGGVRDLLLGKAPKDFDISTDARPETVRALFRNSRIIGRRFRINHVYFTGNKIFEVSTFRATGEADPRGEGLPIRSDNTYGDPQSDAFRRDLTINGLFYDLANFSVIDYVGGVNDLEAGIIRVIGEPEVRFTEDPVRMIRAVRHAARTGFKIEEKTYRAICEQKHLLKLASPARVFEEFVRELQGGVARESLRLLSDTGLLPFLLPPLAERLENSGATAACTLEFTLSQIDEARKAGRELPLAVLFASLFIGNLPQGFFSGQVSREMEEDMEVLWSLDPLSAPAQTSHLTDGRKLRPSSLHKCVELLFKPLGVPKKERERIPQIVAGRCLLVALHQDGGDERAIMSKSYFMDSLALLELTAHETHLRESAKYWRERADDPSHNPGSRSRHRRRRQRPRRRGGRPRP